MAIQDQSDGHTGASPAPAPLPPALSTTGAARRRFAAAGGSGVLLTLASAPGMAATICASPSGSLSGGLQSRASATPIVCEGLSPGYWKEHPEAWPATGIATTDLFGSLFSCNNNSSYKTCQMMTILDHQDFDDNNVGMHMAATYLNIKSGKMSFMTLNKLTAIWNEYRAKTYYTPSAGVKWYGADIVIYLRGTMA